MRREEAQQPLDLQAGPLVRARLLRLAPDEHLLLLTVHHIVSDGWSNSIILRDLCSFYTSFTDNTPLPLPELTLQFADYADWQNARLAADDFAPQRDYWRQKLAGDLPGLDLPYDRPRRAALNVSGDVRSRLLPPELVRAATTLAASESASPFMIFFAVFQVLLHRYTGQVDFLVTSPSANRDRRDFESLVGLFVNPLLLRADLRGDPSFRELLGRVRGGALEAFSNQDIPFESLLDEFQAARLQVNFHYDGGLQQPATLPDGVTLKSIPAVSAGTVYELSASVLEDAGDLRLELEYNTTLFDAETIDRMLGHYQTLLENVVADPAAAISKVPLLTCEERQQLGLEPGPLDLPTSGSPRYSRTPGGARHGEAGRGRGPARPPRTQLRRTPGPNGKRPKCRQERPRSVRSRSGGDVGCPLARSRRDAAACRQGQTARGRGFHRRRLGRVARMGRPGRSRSDRFLH